VADAHRHFGNEYSNRRDYELAVTNYSRAIDLDRRYAEALHSRGVLLWREMGDHQAAVKDLDRVLELDPARTRAHFDRAMARKMLGELEGAIKDLTRYLEQETDVFWIEAAQGQIDELLGQVSANDQD
jgi:tetratricopeptide (TPR) repeat protein